MGDLMEEKGWTFKKDEEGNSLAKGKGASIEYYEMRDKETKRRFDIGEYILSLEETDCR